MSHLVKSTTNPQQIRRNIAKLPQNLPKITAKMTSRGYSGRFRPEGTTAPLRKLVHMNDDDAEKQQRRRTSNQGLETSNNNNNSPVVVGTSRRQSGLLTATSTVDPIHDLSLSQDGQPLPLPTLANYEEWMKLAKDNKITASNSWNFALIDYFYDMSLLKEGDGVNFQKASVTLDGCVKIYTSRVDSAANETDKLLSGLAVGKHLKLASEGSGSDDDDNEDADEEGGNNNPTGAKTAPKKPKRAGETLVKDFNTIRLKKLELELSIDPLFKKMCADFDEGGAKGLLMNSLTLDRKGRVIFDGDNEKGNRMDDDVSDEELEEELEEDEDEDEGEEDELEQSEPEIEPTSEEINPSLTHTEPHSDSEYESEVEDVDLDYLKSNFFPNLAELQTLELCPSLKRLGAAITDPSVSQNILKHLEDIQINQLPIDEDIDEKLNHGEFEGDIDDNDDGDNRGGFDAFGFDDNEFEGNLSHVSITRPEIAEVNRDRDSNMDMGMDVDVDMDMDMDMGMDMDMDMDHIEEPITKVQDSTVANPKTTTALTSTHSQDLMAYFDETLKRNWAGPEHWKIRKLKQDMAQPNIPTIEPTEETLNMNETSTETNKKKTKQTLEINFMDWANSSVDETKLFKEGTAANIKMPWTQWKAKSRHLLPDDRHFSSQNLIKLFLKPRGRIPARVFKRQSIIPQQPQKLPQPPLPASRAEVSDIMVGQLPEPEINADEHFWAQQYQANNNEDDDLEPEDIENPMPDFDDFDYDDYIQQQPPPPPQPTLPFDDNAAASSLAIKDEDIKPFNPFIHQSQDLHMMDFSQTLVTGSARITRPDYVSYAKVAKKVDVKRLKDNMWKVMPAEWEVISDDDEWEDEEDVEEIERVRARERRAQARALIAEGTVEECKFTEIIDDLKSVYPEQQMSEISTSFCFICMLHLANEKGLVIENNEEMTDLVIKKDLTVTKAQLSL